MSLHSGRRFRFGLALFAAAFLIYSLTRAPGLTFRHRGADGGDFLAAAATLGIPHPPGYPTYTLLLRLFMALPVHEPAAAGNLLSSVMGALAVAFCGLIVVELIDLRPRGPNRSPWLQWAAISGALTFAFMPPVWSQALITEVYSFHLALVAAALWLLLRWRRTGRGLALASLVVALGLTHHLTMAFVGPAALALLVGGRSKLVEARGNSRGSRRRPRWRSFLGAGAAFLLGLTPFIYLPYAARRLPPVNWENPQTWDGLRRLVLAARYRHNLLEPTGTEVLARVAEWFRDVPLAYLPLCLLAVAGLLWLLRRDPAGAAATGLLAALATGYALGYGTSDYWVNLLPAMMMVAVWQAVGVWTLLRWLARRRWEGAKTLGGILAVAMPAAMLVFGWDAMDISGDRDAELYVQGVLEAVEPEALVFARGDEGIFSLWYARYALENDFEWVPLLHTFLRSRWYRESLEANHSGLDLRPAGLGEEALSTMVKRHQGRRPIMLTWEDEDLSQHYSLVKVGSLWRVELAGGGLKP